MVIKLIMKVLPGVIILTNATILPRVIMGTLIIVLMVAMGMVLTLVMEATLIIIVTHLALDSAFKFRVSVCYLFLLSYLLFILVFDYWSALILNHYCRRCGAETII